MGKIEKKYKEYELSKSAVDFLNSMTEDYPRKMSELVRQIEKTTTINTTFLPIDLGLEMIEDCYESGGLASSKEAINWLVQKIREYLNICSNNFILFEHGAASKNDLWISQKTNLTFHYFNKEVYLSLCQKDTSNDKLIEETIRLSSGCVHSIGIMSSLPDNILILPEEIDEDIFQLLIKNTEHIISMAFDGEGYIIYSLRKIGTGTHKAL